MSGAAFKPLLAILIFLAGGSLAFGQAGSIGGTIGKTDKSVSGAEAPRKIQSTKKSLARADTGSPCDKVAGSWTWRWANNNDVVTLSPDGTSSATNGGKGNWTCAGRMVRINWQLANDVLTLSSDSKVLSGKGTWGSIVGTRISGP